MDHCKNLRAVLRKLLNFALPRSQHLRRVCDYKFMLDMKTLNKAGLTRRLKFILNHMTVRDIGSAHKKGFFSGEIVTVVASELQKRGVDTLAPARAIMQASEVFTNAQRRKF